jgi:hypothetical protein
MTQADKSGTSGSGDARIAARQALSLLCSQWEAATNSQHIPAPNALVPIPQIRPANYDGRNLSQTCMYGDLPALRKLVAEGADIHANQSQALLLAANNGHNDIISFLLDHGANIHVRNDLALQWAADNGHLETVRLLLDRGADVNAENDIALEWAVESGHLEIVRLLIDHGADVKSDDSLALLIAAENGHTAIVKLLLDRGADLHADEDHALHWAVLNGHIETADFLVARGLSLEKLTPEQRQKHDTGKEALMAVRTKALQAEKTLSEIFRAATWAGHVPEMLQLWNDVPVPLQAVFDFSHALADANIQTMKQRKPKITFKK